MSITISAANDGDGSGPYLNVSNGNFHIVANMLGVDVDYCGEIHSGSFPAIKTRLGELRAQRYVRETVVDGNVVHCGVTLEQAERYIDRLEAIIDYCIEQQQPMVWG